MYFHNALFKLSSKSKALTENRVKKTEAGEIESFPNKNRRTKTHQLVKALTSDWSRVVRNVGNFQAQSRKWPAYNAVLDIYNRSFVINFAIAGEVYNIPAELVKAGGEITTRVLTKVRNKIWRKVEWPNPWTQSMIITLLKTQPGLQKNQSYLKVILTL